MPEAVEVFGVGRPLEATALQDIGDGLGGLLLEHGMQCRSLALRSSPGVGYVSAYNLSAPKRWAEAVYSRSAMQSRIDQLIDGLPPRFGPTVKGPNEPLDVAVAAVRFSVIYRSPSGSSLMAVGIRLKDPTHEVGAQRDAFRHALGLQPYPRLPDQDPATPPLYVIRQLATFVIDSSTIGQVRRIEASDAARPYLPDNVTLDAPAPIGYGKIPS